MRITERINDLAPEAQTLLHSLNERTTELKVTIARVNDLLNDRNRENLAGTLAQTHQMIAENRPNVKATLEHINASSEKLGPLLDDLQKTIGGSEQDAGPRGLHDRRKSCGCTRRR